jgi:hypothetical protein
VHADADIKLVARTNRWPHQHCYKMITTCKLVPDLSTNGNNQCEHICWQAVIFYASLSHPNHQNWFLTKMNFLPRSSIWLPEGAGNDIYIITTEKHAIWLVKSRAASGYPARGILMPSRDFRGILKMSLFYCSYFIKQLPNGFPSNIAWSSKVEQHPKCIVHGVNYALGMLLDFRKA